MTPIHRRAHMCHQPVQCGPDTGVMDWRCALASVCHRTLDGWTRGWNHTSGLCSTPVQSDQRGVSSPPVSACSCPQWQILASSVMAPPRCGMYANWCDINGSSCSGKDEGVAALCRDVAQTNDTSDGLCETWSLWSISAGVVALPG
jgi:hypothetical protein